MNKYTAKKIVENFIRREVRKNLHESRILSEGHFENMQKFDNRFEKILKKAIQRKYPKSIVTFDLDGRDDQSDAIVTIKPVTGRSLSLSSNGDYYTDSSGQSIPKFAKKFLTPEEIDLLEKYIVRLKLDSGGSDDYDDYGDDW